LFLPGDFLSLVREPENPSDPSAIAVHDSCGQRLGYLTPQQSAFLSRIVDSLPISVVGKVPHLAEPGDNVELAPPMPEVIVSVFTLPEFCSGTPADAMQHASRSPDETGARTSHRSSQAGSDAMLTIQ
jgi:hypothetical protein